MLDRTSTLFSHVKQQDTAYVSGGLRDFFPYRDLGIAEATHGKVIAHLVRANRAPEDPPRADRCRPLRRVQRP